MQKWVFSGVLLLLAVPASAADLFVIGGALMGANRVEVSGELYNVRFVDGTCSDLFDGCDEPSDFTFTTLATVTAASVALQNQVFVDGAAGAFNTDPELTNGCSDTQYCLALTPFEILSPGLINTYEAPNWTPPISSPSYELSKNDDQTTDSNEAQVFARWTRLPVAVPMSSTPAMLLILTLMVGTGFARMRSDINRPAH